MVTASAPHAVRWTDEPGSTMADTVATRMATIYGAVGLSSNPFAADPGIGPFVAITPHADAMADLVPWLQRGPGAGLGLVLGCPGSGRTRLMRHIAEMLAPRSDLVVASIHTGSDRRTDAQLLRAIIGALGGEPSGRTGLALTTAIRTLIDQNRERGRDTIILIDDAAFTGSQLEIVRTLLTSTSGVRLVLFGPPELRDRIARRRTLARSLQRVVMLKPMEAGTIRTFLDGRVAAVRLQPESRDAERLFTDEAVAIVASWSGGNPGALVRIAGECVLEAIARSQTVVDRGVAHRVARELTDHARHEARRAAAAPFAEPAVQTRLLLDLEPEHQGTGRGARQ